MDTRVYEFDGSAAVKYEGERVFTVIEGGLGKGGKSVGFAAAAGELDGRGMCSQASVSERVALTAGEWARMFALVVAGIVVAVAIACGQAAAREARVEQVLSSAECEVVTVMPGDTLTSIAERHSDGEVDTESVVNWIRERNGLESSSLVPGQVLEVPVFG